MTTITVIGAGIVGLAVSRALVDRGYRVCMFDPHPPGEGTSQGNAGLIADYATSPMASCDTLKLLPRQLWKADASLSIDPRYLPMLAGFGLRFLRAARQPYFTRNKASLIAMLDTAIRAQHALLDGLEDPDLFADNGCLQVVRGGDSWTMRLERMAAAKRADGVECQAMTSQEVLALEPELNASGLQGGLYYPRTRHLKSPLAVSRALWQQLEAMGVELVRGRVISMTPDSTGGWQLVTTKGRHDSEHVVLCAGIANNPLLETLGIRIPVVSERGYHIRLDTPVALSRPVGWLAHHFYATPMNQGVRLAGTTEFCAPERAADERRWQRLKGWGEALFGRSLTLADEWLGVRHSTPDGLPVVGAVPGCEGLYLAYGHGHLGLTLSAETGRLVAGMIAKETVPYFARSLSPARFLRK